MPRDEKTWVICLLCLLIRSSYIWFFSKWYIYRRMGIFSIIFKEIYTMKFYSFNIRNAFLFSLHKCTYLFLICNSFFFHTHPVMKLTILFYYSKEMCFKYNKKTCIISNVCVFRLQCAIDWKKSDSYRSYYYIEPDKTIKNNIYINV